MNLDYILVIIVRNVVQVAVDVAEVVDYYYLTFRSHRLYIPKLTLFG